MFNKQKIDSGDESINIQAGRDVCSGQVKLATVL